MSTINLDSSFQASFQKHFNQALAEGVKDSFAGNKKSLDPQIAIDAMAAALKENGADKGVIDSILNLKSNPEIQKFSKNFSDLLGGKEVESFNTSEFAVNKNLDELVDLSAQINDVSNFDLLLNGASNYGGKLLSKGYAIYDTSSDLGELKKTLKQEARVDNALHRYHTMNPDELTDSYEDVFAKRNPGLVSPKQSALNEIHDALDAQDVRAAKKAAKAKSVLGKIKSKGGAIGSVVGPFASIGLGAKGIHDSVQSIDELDDALEKSLITKSEYDYQKTRAILTTTTNSITIASGIVTGTNEIAEQITKYAVKNGTKGFAVNSAKQVVKLAPAAGDLLGIAMATASLVQNSLDAEYASDQNNHGRAAMFGVMAGLDGVNIALNSVGLALEFIPGVGNAASLAVNLMSVGVDFVKSLIGVFTDMVDTRAEHEKIEEQFDKYVRSSAFKNEVTKLSVNYKTEGYDIFEYRVDSKAAGIEGSDNAHKKVALHNEIRNLSGKTLKGIERKDLKKAVYDNTGTTESIDLGKGDDLIKLFNGEGVKTVNAGDGDDTLISLDGDHTLNGEKGDDIIFRRNGNGNANGGEGDDSIEYLLSDGVISGGPGNDKLKSDKGHVVIRGDDGDDTILGGFGVNKIQGGTGDDIMDGGLSFDRIDGGKGDDYIVSGLSYDIVDGGEGKDTLSLRKSVQELYNNKFTRDRLVPIGYSVRINANGQNTIWSRKSSYAIKNFSDLNNSSFIEKTKAIKKSFNSDGDFAIDYDLFNSVTKDNIRIYRGKNEIARFFQEKVNAVDVFHQPQGLYLLAEGQKKINGVRSEAKILTNGNNLIAISEDTAFEITLSDLNDFTKHEEKDESKALAQDYWKYVVGQFGGLTNFSNIEQHVDSYYSDLYSGSQANDTITFGRGKKDEVNGYGGDDTFIFDHGLDTAFFEYEGKRDSSVILDQMVGEYHVDGGAGEDTLLIRSAPYYDRSTWYTESDYKAPLLNISNTFSTVLDGANMKIFGKKLFLKNVENIIGRDYKDISKNAKSYYTSDHIVADDIDNKIYGRSGDDLLKGMGGDDLIHGGVGADQLYGGSGNDTLISGGGGQWTTDSDRLYGEEGNDRLVADKAGHVIMEGGTGQDIYQVDATSGVSALIEESDKGNVLAFDNLKDLESLNFSAFSDGIALKKQDGSELIRWVTTETFTDLRELAKSFSETFTGIVFTDTNKGLSQNSIEKLFLKKLQPIITREDGSTGRSEFSVEMLASNTKARDGSDYNDRIVVDRYGNDLAVNGHNGDDLFIATYGKKVEKADGVSTTINTGYGSDTVVIGNTERMVNVNFLVNEGKASEDANTLLIKGLNINKIRYTKNQSRHELSYEGKKFASLDSLPDHLLIEDHSSDITWIIEDIPTYFKYQIPDWLPADANPLWAKPSAFFDRNKQIGLFVGDKINDQVSSAEYHLIHVRVNDNKIHFLSETKYTGGLVKQKQFMSIDKPEKLDVGNFAAEWASKIPGGIRFGDKHLSVTEFSQKLVSGFRNQAQAHPSLFNFDNTDRALTAIASADENYRALTGKPDLFVDLDSQSDVSVTLSGSDGIHVSAPKEDINKIKHMGHSEKDVLSLQNTSADNLWFIKSGNDLLIDVIGSDDEITVQDWYKNDNQKLDVIQAGDLKLLANKVDNLVNAMAAFSAPAGGEAQLAEDVRDQLTPVIAANWQ